MGDLRGNLIPPGSLARLRGKGDAVCHTRKIAACVFVGFVLAFSSAFSQDLAELQRKAESGDAKALFKLGLMYDRGEGVPQNYAEAFKWYRKAAELGHASAQFNLGFSYTYGLGVPKDHGEAIKWLEIAASLGKGGMGEMALKMRKDIFVYLTREQITEAGRLAREWLKKYHAGKK